MNKANQFQKNIRPRQVTLYRNVFYSRVSTTVVLWLCLSFLLQPIERIYAFDEAVAEVDNGTIANLALDAGLSVTESETESEIVAEVSEGLSDESTIVSPEPVESTSTDSGVIDFVESTTTTLAPATDSTSTDVVVVTDTSDTGNATTDVTATTTTTTTTEFTDEEIQELINPEDELPEIGFVESTTSATSTENPVAVSTVFSDAVMQFNKNDCVTVEDGSFYCQNKKDETEQGTDGMYSLQDKDGDLEIFFQKNGELTQLTFNTVDDAAPSFDTKSNSIVWHRLVNERYQIIAFDLDTNEEVQLTADNVNNMEPGRSGNSTVWQRWNGDNWDIVLYDGRETKFITDSPLHDIAPNIKGDLVMWNRLASDTTQSIELYDIATGEYTTITDEEGGALSNPRMVLVYETEFANGDVVTKGYDVDTGEITPLANNPAELPEELPEPDATGETSALVQPKNPTKDDIEITDDLFPGTDGFGSGTSTASSSLTAQPGDLHIASSSPYIAGSTSNTPNATTSEFTLDLTPPAVLDLDVPNDLIVPPFNPDAVSELVETIE